MILVRLTSCLRLHDNPALAAADGRPCVVATESDAALPERSAAWRRHSLDKLAAVLDERGIPLLEARALEEDARGPAALGITEIHLDAGRDPAGEAVAARLAATGLPLSRHGPALSPLDPILEGRLPRSFSAFHRRFAARALVPDPLPVPAPRTPVTGWQVWEPLRLRFATPAGQLPPGWEPGESAALRQLDAFLDRLWPLASDGRDCVGSHAQEPGGSSGLSPWLARGDLGPRLLWQALGRAMLDPARRDTAEVLRRQLVWRDYALALHGEHADLEREPIDRAWRHFPSRQDPDRLAAWREGRTGIPIVDAAMRQLAAEGWIHNRLRMMAGTWLVKQMGQPWQEGLEVFRNRLVDWDPALNAMNWQWCAGCGVDAQPWFRLFSPELQARRTDPEGRLLRRWVPELDQLPLKEARCAWLLPRDQLKVLGYPTADPDPARGRSEALAAWDLFRQLRAAPKA